MSEPGAHAGRLAPSTRGGRRMTSVGAPAAAGLGPLGGLVVVAVAAQLALGGCGSGDDTGAPPTEDPATEPHIRDEAQPAREEARGELPSPARPLRPTAAVPRPTTLRIVNRLSVPVELYRGGFVDRRGPMLRYLNLLVEAVGVQGSLRLEGDGSICPDRAVFTSPSIGRWPRRWLCPERLTARRYRLPSACS